jgi:hypothetical protein
MLVVYIWDAPNAESLMPIIKQLMPIGFDTDIIPAEKVSDTIPKCEKFLVKAVK